MDPANIEGTASACHLVAIPYPGRGHINPMMNLCHFLASRTNDTLITFVVTEEWLGFIGSESTPANIRFATIPNVLPSELVRGAAPEAFFVAAQTRLEEPFEQLLDRLELPVSAIIADTFLQWTIPVGNRRNIPVASFWPLSASFFSILYHFDLIVQNKHFLVELSERGDERVDYIPGLSSMRIADLPPAFFEQDNQSLPRVLKAISLIPRAKHLLFTSIYELETTAIDALIAKMPVPVYSIGPAIPHFSSANTANNNDFSYLKWLDSQPQSSVLYLSLGSFHSVSSAQMDEIAAGLRDCGSRYLWVARGETSGLIEFCGGSGLIVPWCDQLRVLCHSSIGGFWTHCGWNSIKESVFAGVPMLTFPIRIDQIPNSKLVVEDWKIGWKVKEHVGMQSLVKREDIAVLVRRFMDLESIERKEMTKRARELQDICQQAIAKGGSSDTNLDTFVRDISRHSLNKSI